MKKNILFSKTLAAVSVFALAALVTVGCGKNKVTPDEPAVANHFYYGNQTLDIANAVKMSTQGMAGYQFTLNNGYIFNVVGSTETTSTDANFTDMITFLMTGRGFMGTLYLTNDDDNTAIEVASGSFKISEKDGKYEVICLAVTSNNDTIDMYYNGAILDLNKPTGTGSLTVGGSSYPIQVGCMGQLEGLYCYALYDTTMNTTVGISSKDALSQSGTYTITDDYATLTNGNGVSVQYDIVNANMEELEGTLTEGTLTSSVSGDRYTITFSGTSEAGTVSGSFTGSISETNMATIAKKNISASIAKLRK